MTEPENAALEDDPRVLAAAREYLEELEAGRKPSRDKYLSRFPDLEKILNHCFDGIDMANGFGSAAKHSQGQNWEFTSGSLGDFKIVGELGRGGMGIVHEAIQISLGRRVALKVLPFAAALDAKQLQRFKLEAQAAAQLHHSNIVPVYAIGSERGMHYYAMQLIDGRSLDQMIGSLRGDESRAAIDRSATINVNKVSTKKKLRTTHTGQRTDLTYDHFVQDARMIADVASALDYAHSNGILHRDIKPGNLLLDSSGTIWITDFGLAQMTSEAKITRTGDIFGTLRYMSPEQASGKRYLIDHRTDIYSLGATLYELVTLEPIFPDEDKQQLLHKILGEEPIPPRTHNPSIPIDLETIILKSVAKSPADRYTTAAEMAEDLHRFMEERPILARRPTIPDLVRKWLRRHPSMMATVAMFLILSVLTLGISTALVIRSHNKTRAALDREMQRGIEADERFLLAQRAVDSMITLAQEELADNPQLEEARRQILENALTYYQELINQKRSDPNAQAELERTRNRVQHIINDLILLQASGKFFLLGDRTVLDGLHVTAEQRNELYTLNQNINTERQRSFNALYQTSPKEKRERFIASNRNYEAALSAILKPTQMQRLRQIYLQSRGAFAFRDGEVLAELNLSSEQRQQIRTIQNEFFMRPPEPPPGPKQPPGKWGPPLQKKDFGNPAWQALNKILALLSQEQQQKWQELIGEPFQFLPPSPRFKEPKY